MATEADTPGSAAVVKMEANENICSQFGTEVTQSFQSKILDPNSEGKVGNPERESFSESTSLAIKGSEEISKASKDSEEKAKPILKTTEELKIENPMPNDQPDDTVEATGADHVGLVNSVALSTEQKNDKHNEEKLPDEPVSDDLNLQEKKTEGEHGAAVDDVRQKNGTLSDDNQCSAVEHLQSSDNIRPYHVGITRAVSDDSATEGVSAGQSVEEDKAVDSPQKDEREGKKSGEDPNIVPKDGSIVNNTKVEAYNEEEMVVDDLDTPSIQIKDEAIQSGIKEEELECEDKSSNFLEEIVDGGLDTPSIPIKEEEKLFGIMEEELECKEKSSNFLDNMNGSETIGQTEETNGEKEGNGNPQNILNIEETLLKMSKDQDSCLSGKASSNTLDEASLEPNYSPKERNDDNATEPEIQDKNTFGIIERAEVKDAEVLELLEKDKPEMEHTHIKELAPETKCRDLDLKANDADDNMEGTPTEEGLENAAAYTDTIEPVITEDVPDHPTQAIDKEPVIEGLEIVREDKDTGEPIIEKDVVPNNSTLNIGEEPTKDGQAEDEVIKGLQKTCVETATPEPIIEEDVVPDKTTTIFNDSQGKDKVSEGFNIVAEENIEDPIIKENVVPDCSTTTIKDVPMEDLREEDKVFEEGLEISSADKDIAKPIIDEEVPNHCTSTIREKAISTAQHQDKETEGQEIASADKDNGETVTEENPNFTATTIVGEANKDGHKEVKMIEGLNIVGAKTDIGTPIKEEDVPEYLTTSGEEHFKESNEEDKIIVGFEHKDIGEPVNEEDVLEHNTTTTGEGPIKDALKEVKDIEGSEIAGVDKDNEEVIIKEVVVPSHSTTSITEEPTNDGRIEDKVVEELDASANKEIEDPIIEEDVQENSLTIQKQELVNDGHDGDKVFEELNTTSAHTDIGDSIIEEHFVPYNSTTTIVDEQIKNGLKEDKVITVLEDKNDGEPTIEEDVVLDHFTATIAEEPMEDGQTENKVVEGLEIVDANKDDGQILIPNYSTKTIREDTSKDPQEEDKEIEGLKIVGVVKDIEETILDEDVVLDQPTTVVKPIEDKEDQVIEVLEDKNIEEPILEEDVPDHFKTTIPEEPMKDGQEQDKVIEGSEIVDANKDCGEIVIPNHYNETITEGTSKDGQEEDKAIEGLKIVGVVKDAKDTIEPVIAEDDPDHPTQAIEEEPVIEGLEIVGEDKEIGEPIIQKDVVPNNSTINIGEEATKDGQAEDEVIEGLQKTCMDTATPEPIIEEDVVPDQTTTIFGVDPINDSQGKDKEFDIVGEENIEDPIIKENVVPDCTTTTIADVPMENLREEDKKSEGLEIASADKDIANPNIDEEVPNNCTSTIGEKAISTVQNQDKVIEGPEIASEDEDNGETVEEKNPNFTAATIVEEPNIDGHEEDKMTEESNIVGANKDIGTPIKEEDVPMYLPTIGEEKAKESNEDDKIIVGFEHKDIKEPVNEEDVLEHNATTTGEVTIPDALKEAKDIEGLEIAGVDKDNEKVIIKEVVVPSHSTTSITEEPTNDGHIEDKVVDELEASANKEIGDPIIEEDVQENSITIQKEELVNDGYDGDKVFEELNTTGAHTNIGDPINEEHFVPNHSTTTIVDEQLKDVLKEDKVSKVLEDKNVGELITEEDVVLDHFTATVAEEPMEDGQTKDKVVEGLEIVDANKDDGQILIPNYSTRTIREDTSKDPQEEDKVIEVLEDKNIEEPIIEEDVPDHFKTTIPEEPMKDGQEQDKVIEGSEIVNLNKDSGEVVIPPHYNETITEDTRKDGQEEDKAIEGLKIVGVVKDTKDTIIDEDVVLDQPTTTIAVKPIEDGYKDRVPEGSEIASVEKNRGEPKIVEDDVLDNTASFTGESSIHDCHDENKVLEGLDTVDAEDSGGSIIKDIPNHSGTTITEEPTNVQEDKAIEQIETASAVKDNAEPIITEDVPGYCKTTIGEDLINDDHEDDMVIAELDIASSTEIREPGIEESVSDHSPRTTEEQPIKIFKDREKAFEGFKLVGGDKDTEEPIIQKDFVPDHSINVTWEEPVKDGHNIDKITEELEDKDIGEPVKEEHVPDDSTIIIVEEPIKDGHEENKITEELEDKDIGEPVKEEHVPDDSTIIIVEETIKDGHEENKVIGGLEKSGVDKDNREAVIEEVALPSHSTTTIVEDAARDGQGEEKVNEKLEASVEGDASDKQISNDDNDINLYNQFIGEEANCKENEVHKELAIDDADKEAVQQTMEDASITGLTTNSGSEEVTMENFQEDKMEAEQQKGEENISDFSTESTSEAPHSSEKVEPLDIEDEEEQHTNRNAESIIETTVGEEAHKKSSEGPNDASTGLHFEAKDITEKIDLATVEDLEDSHKKLDEDKIKETTEEEIIQTESSEMLDEASSLVPQETEELRNEIIDEEEGTAGSTNDASLIEETKTASSDEMVEGLTTSLNKNENNTSEKEEGSLKNHEESFTEETIKTELTDHHRDYSTQNKEVCEELETVATGQDAGNKIMENRAGMDIYMASIREETTHASSQEVEKETETPGEVKESHLAFIEGSTDSTKEANKVPSEEDPEKILNAFTDIERPLEEISKTQSSDKLTYTSTESVVSGEQLVKEIPEKTEHATSNHDTGSIPLHTEKLSLHEANPEVGESTDASKIASTGTFSKSFEEDEASSQDPDVKDVKGEEISNLDDNVTVNKLNTENSDANAKKEKSDIPAETVRVVTPSVDKNTERTPLAENTASESSSESISEEKSQEFSVLVSDKQQFDTSREKINDESLLDDESVDIKMDPLVAQKEEEVNMEIEEHTKLEKDSEILIKNTVPTISIPKSETETLISEQEDADVILEREKVNALNEFRENSGSETSDSDSKQNNFGSEEKLDEPTGTCSANATVILEQEEDCVEKHDQKLEKSKKESMKVEEMLDDVNATDDSRKVKDLYSTTENVSLAQKNLEEVDPCEEYNNSTESLNHDKSHEALLETEKTEAVENMENIKEPDAALVEEHAAGKNIQEEEDENKTFDEMRPELEENMENIKEPGVALVEEHAAGKNIQEEEDENKTFDETRPELEAGNLTGDVNDVNKLRKSIIVNEEMPRRVERADESENTEKQSINDEAGKGEEVLVNKSIIKEVKDSDFTSTEHNIEATYCNEKTETEILTYVEDPNKKGDVNPDTESSKEESLIKEDCEKYEKVPSMVSEVAEESLQKDIKERDTSDVLHIAPVTVVTEETSGWKAKHEAEKNVEKYSTGTEAEISKTEETIPTCIKGDDIEKMSLHKTSNLVSQPLTTKNENIDQESVSMEKDVNDVVESDIPVKSTEEKSEEDQKNAEAVIPEENIGSTESKILEKTIGNISTTPSTAAETSVEEVCEKCNVDSTFESDICNEGAIKVLVEGGRAEKSFHEDKTGTSIQEDKCDSEDGQNNKSNEANETMNNESLDDEFKSSDVVLVEQDMKQADLMDKTETMTVKDEADKRGKLYVLPVQDAPAEEAPFELIKHLEEKSDLVPDNLIPETITKMSKDNETATKDAKDLEGFVEVKKPSDSVLDTSTMSSTGKLDVEEELLIDNPEASSLTEASQEEIQENEDKRTVDEEKQEVVFIKKPTHESQSQTEESREHIEEVSVAEMTNDDVEKIDYFHIQEKLCTNEEAEIPSTSAGLISKSLEIAEAEEQKPGQAQGNDSEVNEMECEADIRLHKLDEETNTDSKSSEPGVSLFDLLHKSTKEVGTVEQSAEGSPSHDKEELVKEALPTELREDDKLHEKEKVEEGEEEDEDEHKKDDSGSDAPVMVEASRDLEVKSTPKKSHNILSGVGSKVKHSISKVKKAITGKSSHHKQSSPK